MEKAGLTFSKVLMVTSGRKKIFKRIGLFGIIFMLASVYFLLTLIVAMLVSSSLHIINRNLFHYESFDMISGIVTVAIFVFPTICFFRFFKKTYKSLQNVMLKDISS